MSTSITTKAMLVAPPFLVGLLVHQLITLHTVRANPSLVRDAYSDPAFFGRDSATLDVTPYAVTAGSRDRWRSSIEEVIVELSHEGADDLRSRRMHSLRLLRLVGVKPPWMSFGQNGRIEHVFLPPGSISQAERGFEIGIRPNGSRAEHRDQTLAALAEYGAGLDTFVHSDNRRCRIRELLLCSLREFHLEQEELSWTACALIHYLPPQRKWVNRFGDWFTFDDLAAALIEKPKDSESCTGLHILSSLASMLRQSEKYGILTSKTEDRIRKHLIEFINRAEENQREDGAWDLCWRKSPRDRKSYYESATPPSSEIDEVVCVGHLLELIFLIPEDLRPADLVVEKAIDWATSKVVRVNREGDFVGDLQ